MFSQLLKITKTILVLSKTIKGDILLKGREKKKYTSQKRKKNTTQKTKQNNQSIMLPQSKKVLVQFTC